MTPPVSRRHFLAQSSSCAAHLALVAAVVPPSMRAWWARASYGSVVATEPFGNLEQIDQNVWALVSTPLGGDRTTISNGGIIAGRNAVLAIEGFNQPEGARWLGTKARELTGRWPTHIAITHYHGDHANGVAGYAGYAGDPAKPVIRTTDLTRSLVLERNLPADASRAAALNDAVLFSEKEPTVLDLGGRSVRIIPRSGHTSSDISIELDDPSIVFCGDLLWNGMFPNYVDALPMQLSRSVRALRRSRETVYVPGHGALAKATEFDRYVAMIDEVERAARTAHDTGLPAHEAGASFALPGALGEWTLFNKAFYERAFTAWYRELDRRG
ncbi:MAG TPA: MBL fold metallo-hydrolase [Gemmatimonadaceae bacterium]|nr:MBL fold metallo-hydrolase [Gemmatimonadaceae bacterium]